MAAAVEVEVVEEEVVAVVQLSHKRWAKNWTADGNLLANSWEKWQERMQI